MISDMCGKCKGRGYCGKACPILKKFKGFLPKPKLHFSGSSPPEIFVGRFGYPQINTGILSPQFHGQTEMYSMPEIWVEKNLQIKEILENRGSLVYGRFKSNIKDSRSPSKHLSVMQEVSLTSKAVSTEFFLKKKPTYNIDFDKHVPIIGNPAPIDKVRLEENPKVERKVDYLTSDLHVKSTIAISELYKSQIPVSNIIKILSAGMLGTASRRKLVPTRWSITATDDTISKLLLDRIRYYQEISEILLFHAEYVGNHYEFLLLPDKFAFEVIEAKIPGSVWNPVGQLYLAQDHEGFSERKTYADNVTGAYYSNRLALCEYLESIKRQASCLVMRECRPEYYAPLGTGILREASRKAFSTKPEKFSSIQSALEASQKRMRLPIKVFKNKSWLLEEYGKQTRLTHFFN